MLTIIAIEIQKRKLFQNQIDKREFISEMRFEPCFEKWVEFGRKKNTYLGRVCQSVSMISQMLFTFGAHSTLSESHES